MCQRESNEKLKQSFAEYVLAAQSRDLCNKLIQALPLERWILHYQELLHLYKQTFYRTITEPYRQWANISKFHQALVPGDNCLLWHDLCNTFHLVILESKEFYQRVLIQINRNDFYSNHICEKWKTHLGSSRTRSYWLNFENKELKNKIGSLIGRSSIVKTLFFIWMQKAN